MKENSLLHGIGVNNADYTIRVLETVGYKENGKRIQRTAWSCPFYERWANIFTRCYSEKYHSKDTYMDCHVTPEWHYFMTFRSWMEKQDWQGKQLDKDILVPNNKIYGPDTCVFVDQAVNKFLTESTSARGEWPIGVYFYKNSGKFRAQGSDVITGKRISLGYYQSPDEAHKAWLAFKLEQAYILAAEQTDSRIAKALIDRYENYASLN